MKSGNKKRKSVVLRLAVLVFAVYMVISMTSLWAELVSKNKQLEALEREAKEKQLNISVLSQLLEEGDEAELIEKAARERLGYVYADEQVYIDISGS